MARGARRLGAKTSDFPKCARDGRTTPRVRVARQRPSWHRCGATGIWHSHHPPRASLRRTAFPIVKRTGRRLSSRPTARAEPPRWGKLMVWRGADARAAAEMENVCCDRSSAVFVPGDCSWGSSTIPVRRRCGAPRRPASGSSSSATRTIPRGRQVTAGGISVAERAAPYARTPRRSSAGRRRCGPAIGRTSTRWKLWTPRNKTSFPWEPRRRDHNGRRPIGSERGII